MRRIQLICAGLLFFLQVTAQPKPGSYNSLLWRISGNGLQKPSYVYGTMHLTNKQLFYFGDSLYKALETTDGFAAELDMSSAATEYINALIGEEDPSEDWLIVDIVDKKIIDQNKKQLEKKVGKPIGKITVKDLEHAKEAQTREILARGEMKTFMDAYLFDIAARQGKWTGGIEDFEDQAGILNNDSPEEMIYELVSPESQAKQAIDGMIKLYRAQDLDSIDRLANMWEGSRDIILIKRNVKMCRRIDSLARIRTCLFAVGAAHLPGDSGLVSLLRKRGYTLTAVQSSTTIAPDDYHFKEVERAWVDVHTIDSFYFLKMPGKPSSVKSYEGLPLDFQMFYDMGNSAMYMTIGVPISDLTESQRDSTFRRVEGQYRKAATAFQSKDIVYENIKGKEFRFTSSTGEFDLQVFIFKDFLVLNGIFAMQGTTISPAANEKFFHSFKENKNRKLENVTRKVGWESTAFPEHGIAISFPGNFRKKKVTEEDPAWGEKGYEMIDMASSAYYGIIINETKPGYYSSEDSVYYDRVRDAFESNLKAKNVQHRNFSFQGYPAAEFIMELVSENQEVMMKVLLVNRGNRRYSLIASFETGKEKITDPFFSSFSFLPLPKQSWVKQEPPDKSFSIWAPTALEYQEESTPSDQRYIAYDGISLVTMYVEKHQISPYYWTNRDSIMFHQFLSSFDNYNDSTIEYNNISNGNLKGAEKIVQLANTHNQKRMRVFANADTLYTIYAIMPRETLESTEYKKLFDDFWIAGKKPLPATVYERKPSALLQALHSPDTVIYNQARQAFDNVDFLPADIPFLQEALLYQYRDFDTVYTNSNLNNLIAKWVADLDSNHSSISFIKEHYAGMDRKYELVKPYLISILSGMKVRSSYELIKEIITTDPPRISESYTIRNYLYDSLELSRMLYPDLFKAVRDPGLGKMVIGLAGSLLDSNMLTQKDLLPYKDALIAKAKELLPKPKEEPDEYDYEYYDMITILGTLKLPESISLLSQFGKLTNRDLRMQVIRAQAKNNLPIDKTTIYTMATTDEFRTTLYEVLKKYNKLSLFPKEYLTQKFFGQSELYNYITDEEPPDYIDYIGERIATFLGKKHKFYLYRIGYTSVEFGMTEYLGVAGPFSLDPKDLTSTHQLTDGVWEEGFKLAKADEFFKKYLLTAEKDLSEEKED